jgi:hypothetical protein
MNRMDLQLLANIRLAEGQALLDAGHPEDAYYPADYAVECALDRSKLSISVAMWVFNAEYKDWRFLLASRRLDEAKGAAAYVLVRAMPSRRKEYPGNGLRH